MPSSALMRAVGEALSRVVRSDVASPVPPLVVELLSTRFSRDGRHPHDIVAPLPVVATTVIDVLMRTDAGETALPALTNSPRRRLALNLLATAMVRASTLLVRTHHAALVTKLSDDDARIVLALARRWPAPLLTRLELRCETLRGSARVPHRLDVVADDDDAAGVADTLMRSLVREQTAPLEQLGLVTWTERTITPVEDPRFVRHRQQARLGMVSFSVSLRRWLEGKHLAPVEDDEVLLLRSANRGVIGGIHVNYRTLHATDDGRAFLRAIGATRRLVDRRRQAVNQRTL